MSRGRLARLRRLEAASRQDQVGGATWLATAHAEVCRRIQGLELLPFGGAEDEAFAELSRAVGRQWGLVEWYADRGANYPAAAIGWFGALAELLASLPESLRLPVVRRIKTADEQGRSRWTPFDAWLQDLGGDKVRLPEGLTPEAVGAVAGAFLEADMADCNAYCAVCTMAWPVEKGTPMSEWAFDPDCPHGGVHQAPPPPPACRIRPPRLFESCPHCGHPEWKWSSYL